MFQLQTIPKKKSDLIGEVSVSCFGSIFIETGFRSDPLSESESCRSRFWTTRDRFRSDPLSESESCRSRFWTTRDRFYTGKNLLKPQKNVTFLDPDRQIHRSESITIQSGSTSWEKVSSPVGWTILVNRRQCDQSDNILSSQETHLTWITEQDTAIIFHTFRQEAIKSHCWW